MKLVINYFVVQYKIPVQIENEDPIFLGLSLKQLVIIIIGGGIGYSIFKSLVPKVGVEIASIPGIIIGIFTLIVALFKHSEMTFVPFLLNLIRQIINSEPKKWVKGVDSFQPIDIGYITKNSQTKKEQINTKDKAKKIQQLDKHLENI